MLEKLYLIHQEQMQTNTLSVNADGYAQEVEVKIPQGEPTV